MRKIETMCFQSNPLSGYTTVSPKDCKCFLRSFLVEGGHMRLDELQQLQESNAHDPYFPQP
jgi:hypothetical protein